MLAAWLRKNRRQLRLASLAGGTKASVANELAHGRGRDADAEAGELTRDPLVAPARVLARQAQDKLSDLATYRGSTRASPWIRPAPGHHLAVPTQNGVRRDDERIPARSRKEPACGSQEGSISGAKCGSSHLAAKDRKLVAENHDLEFLELLRAAAQQDEREDASEDEVDQRGEQSRPPW
jgi:hypothetical protein